MAPAVQRGLVWEGGSPANQHTLPIIRRQILRPLKPRPLPLSVSHWRISESVFNEEEIELNVAGSLSRLRSLLAAGLARISFQNVLGVFVPCGLVELFGLLFVKIQCLVTKHKVKHWFFITHWEVVNFLCGGVFRGFLLVSFGYQFNYCLIIYRRMELD